MAKWSLAVFGGALLTGALVGRATLDSAAPARAVPVAPAALATPSREKWSSERLLQAARDWQVPDFMSRANPLGEELAQWSEAELRAAITESFNSPDKLLPAGQAVLRYLLQEFLRRDFDAGLAWFETAETPEFKRRLAWELARQWPVERAEEGFARAMVDREYLGKSAVFFQELLIEFHSRSGPAAVWDALQRCRDQGLGATGGLLKPVADGFDFAGLLSHPLDSLAKDDERTPGPALFEQRFIWEWYRQDRDKAFDWLVANRGAEALNAIWSGYPGTPVEGHQQWLASKVEGLTPAQQDEFLKGSAASFASSPISLKLLAEATGSPGLREKMEALAVAGIRTGNPVMSLEVLELNPDPARRIALLETAPASVADVYGNTGPGLNPKTEVQLRAKLAEWNASEAQIESIVARFKPQPPP
ncbi:hypothetical protein [Haloferula sp. BvORR071]|uniref:hypothetical protein n=1 Tax=Haloferula sp. BvORR071 TaxID=1396141 RepID=UPI002240FB2B|nr:hypothetical protein [Haloferula sp. BvORR071]